MDLATIVGLALAIVCILIAIIFVIVCVFNVVVSPMVASSLSFKRYGALSGQFCLS